jgi:hypothetical protein
MKKSLIQLLVVLVVVGVSLAAYDWFFLKPVRDEQARTFITIKIPQSTSEPLNYVAFA